MLIISKNQAEMTPQHFSKICGWVRFKLKS